MGAVAAAKKTLLRAHHAVLARRARPTSLTYWHAVRRAVRVLSPKEDALFPPTFTSLQSRGETLPIPQLADILAADELGVSALDSATITHLWLALMRERPHVIIECGSGVSTIVLAKFLSGFPDANRRHLLTIEQDRSYLAHCATRLKALNLARFVTLLHVPLSPHGAYQFPSAPELRACLDERWIDWIVIDGPFGPSGCRANTLPALAPFARCGARWWLDDALRDGELGILRQWARTFSIDGIYPLGKGLATGRVRAS